VIDVPALRAIMPFCPEARAVVFVPALIGAMEEWGIDTGLRVATFLAQLAHESGELRYMEELATGVAYNAREDLGNTSREAYHYANGAPGPYFKGHGPIQITGFYNHRACSLALFGDAEVLLKDPRRLCEPETGCRGAAWFWASRELNALADLGHFGTVTRKINGGYNGLDDRCRYWARALLALAVTPP
jgi:putative chitinase